jgi:hypothetical protein
MKNLLIKFLNKVGFGGIISLRYFSNSPLVLNGWFLSNKMGSSVDRWGNPLPWLTYPLIQFLEPKLNNQLDIFEYGSGNSTLWFAKRVASITSVEYHREWYDKIRGNLPKNANLQLVQVKDAGYGEMAFRKLVGSDAEMSYVNAIQNNNSLYDLIVIDGLFRPNCIESSKLYLKKRGVFLIDNTEYKEMQPFLQLLTNEGFKHVDFWGMCPINPMLSCTSLYYRDDNWLNI